MTRKSKRNLYLGIVDKEQAEQFHKHCREKLLNPNAVLAKLITDFMKGK